MRDQFAVIAMDLRGHGESDKPIHLEAYAIGRLTDDLVAVADAADVTRFAVSAAPLSAKPSALPTTYFPYS